MNIFTKKFVFLYLFSQKDVLPWVSTHIYENAVVFIVRRPFGAHITNGLISDNAKYNFLETRCSLG